MNEDTVNVFKALSDRTRLKIVYLMAMSGSALCVCEIIDALGESQYNVSRHLQILKSAGLVEVKKAGKWVYYSLARSKNEFEDFIHRAVSALPDKSLSLHLERLHKRLSLRQDGRCVVGVDSEAWKDARIKLERQKG